MEKDFFDDVLIKLKREYQKDEILSAIIKQNSELNIEIGKLKSEIEHLEFELQNQKKIEKQEIVEYKNKLIKEINKEVKLDNTVMQLKGHIKKQDILISSLRKNISELIYQNLNKKE